MNVSHVDFVTVCLAVCVYGIVKCSVFLLNFAFVKVKVKGAYSSLQAGLPYMGSHSVTCHPAEMTFPPLPQPKLVLDLVTPEGCKAELT